MAKGIGLIIGGVASLAADYLVPVVDLGITRATIAGTAGICSMAKSSPMADMMPAGGPCDWTPFVHYGALGAALLLVALGIKGLLSKPKSPTTSA